jgi:hypothetical protein
MKLQCVDCGDFCISRRSHEPFCKGLEKGKPWLMMPITQGNVRVWGESKNFQSWAKNLGINLSSFEEN